MAEFLIDIVAEALLKKVLALAANEVIISFGFKKYLSTLQQNLEYIQAVVHDAEEKQLTSHAVRKWVDDLKDVAYRAELVLDEIEYEILHRKVGAKSSSNPIVFHHLMVSKIKNIIDSLARINKQAVDFNLQPLLNVPIPAYKNEETNSLLDEFGVVGREDDADAIRSLIGSTAEEKLAIIPIVGMGGIGKTTLAKLIYNDNYIKCHFDVRVWVCVRVKVDDVMKILVQILESLTESKVEVKSRETVIKKLKEELGWKKYLLVLDDVWNEEGEFWADFRSCMFNVNEAYGNSIIVTTRSKELSTNASQTSVVHSLDHLSDDQCWSIIKERANFPNGGPSEEDMVGIGQEIARRCCGLPLAAKVVGGKLRSKNRVDWLLVRDSLVQGSSQEGPVLKILKLSYYNLPNPLLKHCFSYCSIFRKDTVMEKAKLIQLWMALGFLEVVEGAGHKDMEEVGHEFFKILVQNSLFRDVEKDDYGNITGCKMHYFVHDLALSISRTHCLSLEGWMSSDTIPIVEDLDLVDVREDMVVEASPRVVDLALVDVREDMMFEVLKHVRDLVHHLAPFILGSQCLCLEGSIKNDSIPKVKDVALYNVREDKMFEVLKHEKARYLRTLFLEGARSIITEHISLNHFKCLRILNLKDSGLKMLPYSIGKLIHLRYLDLSDTPELYFLPRSIGRLYHLQTLRLNGCSDELKLPNEVGNLISLRHLYINEECNIAPFNIGRLTCLQTLEYFYVGKEKGQCIEVLGPLKNLRGMLKLDHLENVSSKREALSADLIGKLGLNKLVYDWVHNINPNHKDVLEGLRAPPNLKVLMFDGYMGENFPEWVMKMAVIGMDQKLLPLHNLVDIAFSNCKRCERVPMLGQLPHLQKLMMWGMENMRCIDESFYGYSGGSSSFDKSIFPALRILKMVYMENLEMWMDVNVTRKDTIGGGEGSSGSGGGWLVFPHLEVLELIECPMINSLPYEALTGAHLSLKRLKTIDCGNLRTIPTLQGFASLEELSILNCKGLTSLPELPFHHSLRKLRIFSTFEKLIRIPKGYLSGVANTLEELEIGPLSSETQLMKLCLQSIFGTPTSHSHSLSPSTSSSLQQLLQSSPILRELTLYGELHWDSIPEEVQHLTALAYLKIQDFGSVKALPEWFAHLSSLKELHLVCCYNLRSLPSTKAMRGLTKLKKIVIDDCPPINERIARRSGPEWFKVSHIPNLYAGAEL